MPSETATEVVCYKFVWCFQDGRVHTVLPDCLGGAMLSLRPENLQPLTKGTLLVLGTALCSPSPEEMCIIIRSRGRWADFFCYDPTAVNFYVFSDSTLVWGGKSSAGLLTNSR